jgi:hypothetical protein
MDDPTRRDVLKVAGVAGTAALLSEKVLSAAPAPAAPPAAPLIAHRSTTGVFIPPRGESFMSFSFDAPEPSVRFAGLDAGFAIFSRENTYRAPRPRPGLDRARRLRPAQRQATRQLRRARRLSRPRSHLARRRSARRRAAHGDLRVADARRSQRPGDALRPARARGANGHRRPAPRHPPRRADQAAHDSGVQGRGPADARADRPRSLLVSDRQPLTFHTAAGERRDFVPLYQILDERYGVYVKVPT